MYQYKAVLRSTKQIIVEGHDLKDIEAGILHFRRGQKHGEHTSSNVPIDIYHVKRHKISGHHDDVLVKTI